MSNDTRKFRGWSKDRNEYIPPDQIHQLFLRMDGRVFWLAYDGIEDVTDKIDIEFSTGKFDMKRTEEFPEGQEIYQGDIVNRKDWKINPDYRGALDYPPIGDFRNHLSNNGSYLETNNRFRVDSRDDFVEGDDHLLAENVTIIGTIHDDETGAVEETTAKA